MSSGLALSAARWKRAFISGGDASRLEAFRAKLARKEKIVYGAIGGSITEGASASSPWRRYASRFAIWLDSLAPCELVNAGIGASNSLFGAFRLEKDLLSRNPDMITIEFAVNDPDSNPDMAASYEALVRQCALHPKKPLIVLIFNMRKDGTNAQHVHVPVGRHYNLAMLSTRDGIYPEIQKGQLKWSDYSPDEVHPNDAGHELISKMLEKFVVKAEPEKSAAPSAENPPFMNPAAIKYIGGRILDLSKLELLSCSGWTQGPHRGGYLGLQSEAPGSVFEVAFEGSNITMGSQQYAGGFGRVSVSIDGGGPRIVEGFYERPPIIAWAGGHTVLNKLGEGLKPGRHVMRVELLSERHKDSSGHKFDFGYLLVS